MCFRCRRPLHKIDKTKYYFISDSECSHSARTAFFDMPLRKPRKNRKPTNEISLSKIIIGMSILELQMLCQYSAAAHIGPTHG